MTAALKARTGTLEKRDCIALEASGTFHKGYLPSAPEDVACFLEAVDAYPMFASDRLMDAARNMMPVGVDLSDPMPVLKQLENDAVENGWAMRKDCGHG